MMNIYQKDNTMTYQDFLDSKKFVDIDVIVYSLGATAVQTGTNSNLGFVEAQVWEDETLS